MSSEYLNKLFSLEGEVVVVIGGTGELGGALSEGLAQAGLAEWTWKDSSSSGGQPSRVLRLLAVDTSTVDNTPAQTVKTKGSVNCQHVNGSENGSSGGRVMGNTDPEDTDPDPHEIRERAVIQAVEPEEARTDEELTL